MTSEEAGAGPFVVVTTRSFGSGAPPRRFAGMRDSGWRRRSGSRPCRSRGGFAHGGGMDSRDVPDRHRHLAAAPNLKIVSRYGTGYDSVDLAAAARRGVIVTKIPGANAEAVADHTVGLMPAVLRHLVAGDRASREGVRLPLRGRELGAPTVGIIGFGRIGRAVAYRLIGGFGSRVLAYDPFVAPERAREAGIEPVGDLAGLARAADVLTLHMPGGGSAVVDAAFLSRMRPGAVLITRPGATSWTSRPSPALWQKDASRRLRWMSWPLNQLPPALCWPRPMPSLLRTSLRRPRRRLIAWG